jgi:hypothetical protein
MSERRAHVQAVAISVLMRRAGITRLVATAEEIAAADCVVNIDVGRDGDEDIDWIEVACSPIASDDRNLRDMRLRRESP